MASKSSAEYYSNLKEMSPIRAIAETLINDNNVRKLDIRQAYEMAKKQPGVIVTDLPVYPEFVKLHNLPADARCWTIATAKSSGAPPKPYRFYHRLDPSQRTSWKEISASSLADATLSTYQGRGNPGHG